MKNYLYEQGEEYESSWAIVAMPEIFGLNQFIKGTVDRLADMHHVPTVALDHMYLGAGESKVYDYVADRETAHHAMVGVHGDAFIKLFSSTVDDIQVAHPTITSIAVIGYCFGGRLAYLSGVDKRVSNIVSYYGAGPHTDNYYEGKTVIQALAAARAHDPHLVVTGLYGGADAGIPETDRARTKEELTAADINYTEVVYPTAGHAFCNHERADRYDAAASTQSIALVDDILFQYFAKD